MTLTREKLFALKPTIASIKVEGFGEVYVKALTELQRSKRLTQMFDSKGKANLAEQARNRVYMIIDQLCEKDGKQLFNEGDSKDLLALDALKIDNLCEAISNWNDTFHEEKNEKAE